MLRLAVTLHGVVQGVGFRPFVHASATRRGLRGWVRNRRDGVALEVEGVDGAVRDFVASLAREAPAAARIARLDVVELPATSAAAPAGEFRILPSSDGAETRASLPADLATCAACDAETADPASHRHRYPFTSCAHCGPRYGVVEALPYDRAATTMRDFPLCERCRREYEDPADRRFHAETIACPACGPTLRLLAPDGSVRARADDALRDAVDALCAGAILALQGLGGFQLLVDATDAAAVARLRTRKRRPHKPFAVLFASPEAVSAAAPASAAELDWLASPAAPIVLLDRAGPTDGCTAPSGPIADEVAPDNPHLGAMLPATPLHRLLAEGAGRPLVCTSGNLSEEPICIDPDEALARLGAIADLFLVHDRRIARPVDDSLARVGTRGVEVLRRARGFAPLPLAVPEVPAGIVALGGERKGTVVLSLAGEVVVSQHLGDLNTIEGAALLERTVDDLLRLFAVTPRLVACDLHPDYASTRLAERLAAQWRVPLERVQHHHAHVAACMAEHAVDGPILGLAWDGAGFGCDGTIWGGEAFVADGARCRRVAHLRPVALAGGDRAMREPRRSALALLHGLSRAEAAAWAPQAFAAHETRVLLAMLDGAARTVPASSVGRLFDGVAALVGLCRVATFEGQAAMRLEFAAGGVADAEPYPITLGDGRPAVADWAPLVRAVLDDLERGAPAAAIAARFHAALAFLAGEIAQRAGIRRVALAGGCFQNRLLARAVRARLEQLGFAVLAPQAFPPNDGALSLGQVLIAARRREEEQRVPRHPG